MAPSFHPMTKRAQHKAKNWMLALCRVELDGGTEGSGGAGAVIASPTSLDVRFPISTISMLFGPPPPRSGEPETDSWKCEALAWIITEGVGMVVSTAV